MVLAAIGALLTQAVGAAGLWFWARWVARRQGGPQWKRAEALPILGFFAWFIGLCGTLFGLWRAFGRIESLPPEAKVAALSNDIQLAMGSLAIFLPLSLLAYLLSIVLSTVGTIKRGPE